MNKETLQTNNARIQTNNTDLNTILETINSLPTGAGAKYTPTMISFYGCQFPMNDDGSYYDMSNEINGLDTSKVIKFDSSFSSVSGINRLDLSTFDTSRCESFLNMFENSSFEYIDVSSFTFDRCNEAYYMFSSCQSLTTVVLGEGWLGLTSLMIEDPWGNMVGGGGFGSSVIPLFENTPIDNGEGYVYVPDELVNQFKEHEVFNLYADQIRPKSELS